MNRWTLLALLVFGCMSSIPVARACSCSAERAPIAAYKETPVVFIGTVTSVREDKASMEGMKEDVRIGLAAYFVVNERFKGITETQATVLTGGNRGGCGSDFEAGRTYAVFAWPIAHDDVHGRVAETTHDGHAPTPEPMRGAALSTSICNLTAELVYRRPHMAMIRDFQQGKVQPMIFGQVREYGHDFSGSFFDQFIGPMPRLEVLATGNGRELTTLTDETGEFVFPRLASGEYLLSMQLPDSHRLHRWSSAIGPVTLKSSEDSAEVSIGAQLVNRIGGTLTTAQGAPITNKAQLTLIRLSSANKPLAEIESHGTFARNGTFAFEAVPPGKYIIGISAVRPAAKNSPYPKTYYPRGDTVEQALVFDVTTPTVIDDLIFQLPPELATRQVSGVVVDAERKRVSGATVNIFDAQMPEMPLFGFVKTDAAGRFLITGFEGRKHLLHAYGVFAGKGMQSQLTEITFTADAKPTLVLDRDGTSRSQLE